MHTHERGWQMEQESRVCGQGGRCQGTFSSMTQSIGLHFPSTSRKHIVPTLVHKLTRAVSGDLGKPWGYMALPFILWRTRYPTSMTLLSNLRTEWF